MAEPADDRYALSAPPSLTDRIDDALRRYGLHAAFIVALVATLGSLYFSNVRLYKPCVLCWYQRIFMYPLTLSLAGGIIARDGRRTARYVIPPALAGTAVATYHVLLQKTDWLPETPACVIDVPCSAGYIFWLGFITIPVLSLIAFLLILLCVSATLSAVEVSGGQGGALGAGTGDTVRRRWLTVVGTVVAVVVVFVVIWALDAKASVALFG
ncbi:MAG: disulfide oxidoreductase [Ardenticatenales bacterium]